MNGAPVTSGLLQNRGSSRASVTMKTSVTSGRIACAQKADERGVSRTAVTAAFFAGCAVMAASLVVEKWALAPAFVPAAHGVEKARQKH